MVETASSSLGSLYIKAGIDDTMLQAGFVRMRQGLDNVAKYTKSTTSDMGKLAGTVKGLAKSFLTIAGVGVGSLAALASMSPALASSMAKLQIGMFKLGQVVGTIMKPMFEALANDLLPAVIGFLKDNRELFNTVFGAGAETIKDMASIINGEWTKITDIFSKLGLGLTMGAAGFAIGGFPGALIGAALGWTIGSALGDNKNGFFDRLVSDELNRIKSVIPSSVLVLGMAAAGWAVGGFPGALLGMALGMAIDSGANALVNAGASISNEISGKNDKYDRLQSYSGAYQQGRTGRGYTGGDGVYDVSRNDDSGFIGSMWNDIRRHWYRMTNNEIAYYSSGLGGK